MAKRRFICTPQDLAEFHVNVQAYLALFRKYHGGNMILTLRSHVNRRIHTLYRLGLSMDETTKEAYRQWQKTYSRDDLHYVLHHIVWQIWDGHNRGVLRLDKKTYERYTKVTSDCIHKD